MFLPSVNPAARLSARDAPARGPARAASPTHAATKEPALSRLPLRQRLTQVERRLRDSLGTDIATPAGRRRALLDFYLLDHGALRALYANLHRIDAQALRSSQPSPAQLARFARLGVRSVLNLRGATAHSHYLFEAEACDRLGLALHTTPMSATLAPQPAQLLDLLALFRRIETPFVMHCKSGSDRTGLAAALYLIEMRGAPLPVARRQLHWRFGHFRSGRAGILDAFLDRFAEAQARGLALADWLRDGYDPVALARDRR